MYLETKVFGIKLGVTKNRSRNSSVSIVSDYGLDDRENGVRSPASAKDFSSNLCVQTGSEARPASCTMGIHVIVICVMSFCVAISVLPIHLSNRSYNL
jgi:hypothetical protein